MRNPIFTNFLKNKRKQKTGLILKINVRYYKISGIGLISYVIHDLN